MIYPNPFTTHACVIMLLFAGACEPVHEVDSPNAAGDPSPGFGEFQQEMALRIQSVRQQLIDLERSVEASADSLTARKSLAEIELATDQLESAIAEMDSMPKEAVDRQREALEKRWLELEADIEAMRLQLAAEEKVFEGAVDARLDEMRLELLDVERHTRSLIHETTLHYTSMLAELKHRRKALKLQFDSLESAASIGSVDDARDSLIEELTLLGAEIRVVKSELKKAEYDTAIAVSETD